MNETTFTVNWIEPAEVNGVLLTYTIAVNEEESSSADTKHYNTLATSFSIHELGNQIFNNLYSASLPSTYSPLYSLCGISGCHQWSRYWKFFASVVQFTAEGSKVFLATVQIL